MGLGFYDLDNDVVMTNSYIPRKNLLKASASLGVYIFFKQIKEQVREIVHNVNPILVTLPIPLHGIKIVQVITTLCSLKPFQKKKKNCSVKPSKGVEVANSCVRPWVS